MKIFACMSLDDVVSVDFYKEKGCPKCGERKEYSIVTNTEAKSIIICATCGAGMVLVGDLSELVSD